MKKSVIGLIFYGLFWLSWGTCWIVNLVKLAYSDFVTPAWGQIVVHGIGVLIAPASVITVWFK